MIKIKSILFVKISINEMNGEFERSMNDYINEKINWNIYVCISKMFYYYNFYLKNLVTTLLDHDHFTFSNLVRGCLKYWKTYYYCLTRIITLKYSKKIILSVLKLKTIFIRLSIFLQWILLHQNRNFWLTKMYLLSKLLSKEINNKNNVGHEVINSVMNNISINLNSFTFIKNISSFITPKTTPKF